MRVKVLIVEDSKASREYIAATVESVEGIEAVVTSSGFEALKLLPRHRFELIITDINMPDINGLELINFVKKNPNYRQTPLFIITRVFTRGSAATRMACAPPQLYPETAMARVSMRPKYGLFGSAFCAMAQSMACSMSL